MKILALKLSTMGKKKPCTVKLSGTSVVLPFADDAGIKISNVSLISATRRRLVIKFTVS